MRYLWRLFSHFIFSNSRHGTHSPFVYGLAEEVIYAKSKKKGVHSGQECLLFDIAEYLGVTYASSAADIGMDKAIIIEQSLVDIDELARQVRRFKYLVIPAIYQDRLRMRYWSAICDDDRFIVCIDLFYYGLVFYRSEQPKELFKLRFPYRR